MFLKYFTKLGIMVYKSFEKKHVGYNSLIISGCSWEKKKAKHNSSMYRKYDKVEISLKSSAFSEKWWKSISFICQMDNASSIEVNQEKLRHFDYVYQ